MTRLSLCLLLPATGASVTENAIEPMGLWQDGCIKNGH